MIRVSELDFAYAEGAFRLRIDQFSVRAGEHVAVIGPSGSGKSTLLCLLAGILLPRDGRIVVAGHDLARFSEAARRDFRSANIGLVFQEFELLEYLDVLDNILLPFRINGTLRLTKEVLRRAKRLAGELGIGDQLGRLPGRLSHGEKQWAAIGRALVAQPRLLLADEPTGNLDPANKDRVLDLMMHHAAERGLTVVLATHDHGLLERFETVIDVADFHSAACGRKQSSLSPPGRGLG